MLVFRVVCFGPGLPHEAPEAQETLTAVGARWEGSESHGDGSPDRHSVLVGAPTSEAAIAAVRSALGMLGSFEAFEATPVRTLRGEVRNTPIPNGSTDIDWDRVEAQAPLTGLQRALVQTILDAAEPTWQILADPDVPDDRGAVEAAMKELEARALVSSTWEASGNPSEPHREMCRWWALTDEGWDLLGLIRSPGYH